MADNGTDLKLLALVVHGVGEHAYHGTSESVAKNWFTSLKDRKLNPSLDVRLGESNPRQSIERALDEVAHILTWETLSSSSPHKSVELHFRDVHWSDLKDPFSWKGWLKLVWWSISMSGCRAYTEGDGTSKGMELPLFKGRKKGDSVSELDRLQLLGISTLFILLLGTFGVINFLLARLRFPTIPYRQLISDYLGDVRLYQDWAPCTNGPAQMVGKKPRTPIRGRMVDALILAAMEVKEKGLDGYFVFAHSLGTVVSFNGLMMSDDQILKHASKQVLERYAQHNNNDKPTRSKILAKALGYITIGSPLDKFAAIWPAIVPINPGSDGRTTPVPWVNIHDPQDIVAGSLEAYKGCEKSAIDQPVNHAWAGNLTLGTAHTSYWDARTKGNDLLTWMTDRIQVMEKAKPTLPLLDSSGQPAAPLPDNLMSVGMARTLYAVGLGGLGLLAALGASYIKPAWFSVKSFFVKSLEPPVSWDFEPERMFWIVVGALGIAVASALLRAVMETIIKKEKV